LWQYTGQYLIFETFKRAEGFKDVFLTASFLFIGKFTFASAGFGLGCRLVRCAAAESCRKPLWALPVGTVACSVSERPLERRPSVYSLPPKRKSFVARWVRGATELLCCCVVNLGLRRRPDAAVELRELARAIGAALSGSFSAPGRTYLFHFSLLGRNDTLGVDCTFRRGGSKEVLILDCRVDPGLTLPAAVAVFSAGLTHVKLPFRFGWLGLAVAAALGLTGAALCGRSGCFGAESGTAAVAPSLGLSYLNLLRPVGGIFLAACDAFRSWGGTKLGLRTSLYAPTLTGRFSSGFACASSAFTASDCLTHVFRPFRLTEPGPRYPFLPAGIWWDRSKFHVLHIFRPYPFRFNDRQARLNAVK